MVRIKMYIQVETSSIQTAIRCIRLIYAPLHVHKCNLTFSMDLCCPANAFQLSISSISRDSVFPGNTLLRLFYISGFDLWIVWNVVLDLLTPTFSSNLGWISHICVHYTASSLNFTKLADWPL